MICYDMLDGDLTLIYFELVNTAGPYVMFYFGWENLELDRRF